MKQGTRQQKRSAMYAIVVVYHRTHTHSLNAEKMDKWNGKKKLKIKIIEEVDGRSSLANSNDSDYYHYGHYYTYDYNNNNHHNRIAL